MARVLLWISPFAAAAWTLALVAFARPSAPRAAVGAALILSGWAVAVWAAGYRRPGKAAPGDGAGSYFFSGPYGWVRNPSQVALVCAAVGLTFWSGALWPWPAVGTAVLLLPLLTVVQNARDAESERRLGWAYRTFRATVPIWIPRFTARPNLAKGRWRPGPALKGSIVLLAGTILVAAAAFLRPGVARIFVAR